MLRNARYIFKPKLKEKNPLHQKAKNWEFYYNIYISDQYKTFRTNIDIKKSGYIKLGMSSASIIKNFNKPIQVRSSSNFLPIKTFYYKLKIADKKAICELSFYKNQLIHFTYQFKYLNKDEKEKLLSILFTKYIKNTNCIANCRFIDKHGNRMIIEDLFNLNISYFAYNHDIINKLYLNYSQEEQSLINGTNNNIEKLCKIL